jgi:glutamate dehydrogenase
MADQPQFVSDALAQRLTRGALPGELQGFGPDEVAEAARFVAGTARQRRPGEPAIALEPIAGEDVRRRMRLAIVNDDMPFLVDSIAAAIAQANLAIDRIIHPVIRAGRDGTGALEAVGGTGRPESMIYIELERADARERRDLVATLFAVLADVRAAVSDWPALQRAVADDEASLPPGEGAALLQWFLDGNMTLLGHQIWRTDGTAGPALGIARNDHRISILAEPSRVAAVEWFRAGGEAPLLLKSSLISPVHRAAPLDLVVVPLRDGNEITGLSIHSGLWTSGALAARPDDVPVLRARLSQLEAKFGFDPKGHAGKALTHAFTQLPHDLLIAFEPQQLEELALAAMSLADRPRPALVLVRSALGRHLYAFAWLLRDDLTTARRIAFGELLAEAAKGPVINWSVALEDSQVALIRYTIDLRRGGQVPDTAVLQQRLERMVRGWAPAVEAALSVEVGPARAARYTLRHANCFPQGYRTAYTAEEAAADIMRLVALDGPAARVVRLSPGADVLKLKIYRQGGPLALSDAVPVLENFGFRVIEEIPTALTDEARSYVHEFVVEAGGPLAGDLHVLERAIAAALENRAENDQFNRLIVDADLPPQAVVLFRAWFRYLRQAGMTYGLATVVDALRRAPDLARALVARFAAAHGPEGGDLAAADAAIEAGLEAVAAIDDDRILRGLRAVIAATLRTNAFAPAGAEALAFKLDSARIPGLPAPLPWREVWVYSPRVEGIHLRAGPGCPRWPALVGPARRFPHRGARADEGAARQERGDRTDGAKGGFYPKQLPPVAQRDAWLAEGTESYRVFIRALLSITDNIVDGAVVHPEGIRVTTATIRISSSPPTRAPRPFPTSPTHWRWNAASGWATRSRAVGQQGYDHKAMGITAKGAWISVQRHFAERGIDVQTQPITVVGCGDMSGDVFGNGMLLSKAIKLVAAFDHRHIFLDPDPDPATSWAERARPLRPPPVPPGPTMRARSPPAAASIAARPSRSPSRRRRRARWASSRARSSPQTSSPPF